MTLASKRIGRVKPITGRPEVFDKEDCKFDVLLEVELLAANTGLASASHSGTPEERGPLLRCGRPWRKMASSGWREQGRTLGVNYVFTFQFG